MTNMTVLVCGPTGVGKTCVIEQTCLLEQRIRYLRPITTRSLRHNEIDKVSVSAEEFERMALDDEFVIVNELYGARYGTSKRALWETLQSGYVPILDWPVHLVSKFRQSTRLDTLVIYLCPSSWEDLSERNRDRLHGERKDAAFREWVEFQNGAYTSVADVVLVVDRTPQQLAEQLLALAGKELGWIC